MDFTLTRSRIRNGQYEGVLAANGRHRTVPEIVLKLLGAEIGTAKLSANATDGGKWIVEAKIPAQAIGDGAQTVLFCARDTGEVLDTLVVVAGEALQEDVRAELSMLRAELELLKTAFRQHCAETTAKAL